MKHYTLCLLLAILFFVPTSFSQQFEWGIGLGSFQSGSNNAGMAVTTDSSGNVYSTGYFSGTVDFDPGPGISNLIGPVNLNSIFILKQDSSGGFIWAKKLETTSACQGTQITTDPIGNVLISGFFWDSCDFDPGPGIYRLHAENPDPMVSRSDCFLLKLDAQGNFIWANVIHGPGFEGMHFVKTDRSGNVFLWGDYEDSVDVDPGPGVVRFKSEASRRQGIVAKYNSLGDFVWAKEIDCDDRSLIFDLALDNQNNVFLAGYFNGTVDMDPGPAIDTVSNSQFSSANGFVIKLNQAGDYQWHRRFSGRNAGCSTIDLDPFGDLIITGGYSEAINFTPDEGDLNMTTGISNSAFVAKLAPDGPVQWARSIGKAGGKVKDIDAQVDVKGRIFIAGRFESTIDAFFGPGEFLLTPKGDDDIYIIQLDNQGSLINAQSIGGKDVDLIEGFHLGSHGDIFLAGAYRDTMDVDPGSGSYNLNPFSGSRYNIFLLKLDGGPCWNMAFAIDSILVPGCSNSGFIRIKPTSPKAGLRYVWRHNGATDPFIQISAAGTYTVDISDLRGCTRTIHFYMNGPENMPDYDWHVSQVFSPIRPGFNHFSWLEVKNRGCQLADNEFYLVEDDLLKAGAFSIPPDRRVGDTLFWNLENYNWDQKCFKTTLTRDVSLKANIGDQVCEPNLVKIKPNESDTTNNRHPLKGFVVNSYDPNDVRVSPAGFCEKGLTPPNTQLTYTIRFQNTGTADAVNIVVLDSVGEDLDMSSFRLRSVSHEPVNIDIEGEQQILFSFPNIHLTDSTTNEAESHGYIVFSIDQKPGLPDGVEIKNKAEIYFDFNEPVITNTALNTIFSGTLTDEVEVRGGTLMALQNGASYQWVDCNNNRQAIPGATNQTFNPVANGRYAVEITLQGCSYSSECVALSSVGIEENLYTKNIRHYPNPSRGEIHIDLPKRTQNLQLKVFDIAGRLVQQHDFKDLSSLKYTLTGHSGLYLVQLRSKEGTSNLIVELVR